MISGRNSIFLSSHLGLFYRALDLDWLVFAVFLAIGLSLCVRAQALRFFAEARFFFVRVN